MEYQFRQATAADAPLIWNILQWAIEKRKADGSEQWQDGYPNKAILQQDIDSGAGYVLTEGKIIIGYVAIFVNNEPEYAHLKGSWLTNGEFVVFHRIAISTKYSGKGLAQIMLRFIEDFARSKKIYSVKADTNFDNIAMIKTFDRSGYTFCGEVTFKGKPIKAYEKVLI